MSGSMGRNKYRWMDAWMDRKKYIKENEDGWMDGYKNRNNNNFKNR